MTNASQKHHKTLKEQELQGCMADTRLLLIWIYFILFCLRISGDFIYVIIMAYYFTLLM